MTSIEDERGITYANWDYDYLKGTMSSHADGFEQVTLIVGQAYGLVYRYDNANRLAEMVYPSGRVIQYSRDAFGQINQIIAKENDTATAPSTTLLSAVQHKPFGPPNNSI